MKHVASACFENSNSSVIEVLGLLERVAGRGSRRFEGTCLQEFKVISQEDGIRVASACTCLFSGIFQMAVLVFIPSDFWYVASFTGVGNAFDERNDQAAFC